MKNFRKSGDFFLSESEHEGSGNWEWEYEVEDRSQGC